MASGRKPKPTVLKELDGTKADIKAHVELEKTMPAFDENNNLIAPDWLKKDKIAKAEWDRVAPILVKTRLLTQADVGGLEAYCKCWSRYRGAEVTLDKLGTTITMPSGYSQPRPEVTIAQRYLKICKDFMIEFGLTPSSRGRMSLPGQKDDDDDMENMFKDNG